MTSSILALATVLAAAASSDGPNAYQLAHYDYIRYGDPLIIKRKTDPSIILHITPDEKATLTWDRLGPNIINYRSIFTMRKRADSTDADDATTIVRSLAYIDLLGMDRTVYPDGHNPKLIYAYRTNEVGVNLPVYFFLLVDSSHDDPGDFGDFWLHNKDEVALVSSTKGNYILTAGENCDTPSSVCFEKYDLIDDSQRWIVEKYYGPYGGTPQPN